MSTMHLSLGSRQPAKVPGKLRLYSMEYCPYAQRVRLILRAKNIPHDIVNINLINKPEWYFRINAEGKVPALDTGSRILTESLEICDYLEEQYPNPPLYPSDRLHREKDKDLIQKIGPITTLFNKVTFGQERKSPSQWVHEFEPHFDRYENELEKRGSTFFGGEKPGMIDYMIWPWAERAGAIFFAIGRALPFHDENYPNLKNWRKEMKAKPVVAGIYNGPEKFWRAAQYKIKGIGPDFDSI